MIANRNAEYQPNRRMKMRKTILRHDPRKSGLRKVNADVLGALHKRAVEALDAGSEPVFNNEFSKVGKVSEAA